MSTNPRIQSIDLGTRELKSFRIFPLSMADQFRLTDAISKVADEYQESQVDPELPEEEENAATNSAKIVLRFLQENIGSVLSMVTEESNRPSLSDIDNVQLSELVELLYSMNYENTIKNFQGFIKKVKDLFP